MRIAMPYKDGQIFPHMGQAEFFKFYNVEGNQLLNAFTMASGVSGHEATAAFLRAAGVNLVICGGLGGPMIKALSDNSIMVMGGIIGDADQRLQEFLAGTLNYRPIDPSRAGQGCHHHHSNHSGCSHHGEDGTCNHPDGTCEHPESCDHDGCCH